MKTILLFMFSLSSTTFANTYLPPVYQDVRFLANTAFEMKYRVNPEAPVPPEVEKAFIDRAHGTCRALGHNRARFALPEDVSYEIDEERKQLILVDLLGFMQVKEIPYIRDHQGQSVYPTYFRHLECF